MYRNLHLILAVLLHVARTHCARNVTELVLVLVCLNTLEILTPAAALNVSQIQIVIEIRLVRTIAVKILVQGLVVSMQNAELSITRQRAAVYLAIQEIHRLIANPNVSFRKLLLR